MKLTLIYTHLFIICLISVNSDNSFIQYNNLQLCTPDNKLILCKLKCNKNFISQKNICRQFIDKQSYINKCLEDCAFNYSKCLLLCNDN